MLITEKFSLNVINTESSPLEAIGIEIYFPEKIHIFSISVMLFGLNIDLFISCFIT